MTEYDENLLKWERARDKIINVIGYLNGDWNCPGTLRKKAQEVFEYIVNLRSEKEQQMTTEKLETMCEEPKYDVMHILPKPISQVTVAHIKHIKSMGNDFHAYLEALPETRGLHLAKTKLEECVMWAVKGIS